MQKPNYLHSYYRMKLFLTDKFVLTNAGHFFKILSRNTGDMTIA